MIGSLPLTPDHAARLLLRACVRVGRLRVLYDPDQPRDEGGKWTSGGPDVGPGKGYSAVQSQLADDPKHWAALTKENRTSKTATLQQHWGRNRAIVQEPGEEGEQARLLVVDTTDAHWSKGPVVAILEYGAHSNEEAGVLEGVVQVHPDYRRQGIATKLYDVAEEVTGERFAPSPLQTERAKAFWQARRTKMRGAEFNPDQPRDDSGRWTSDAGGFLSRGGQRVTAFHGTPDKDLTVADLNPDAAIEVGGATFFTTDEDTAWQYTHEREYGEIVGESSENVIEAQFRMKNPMVVDMEGEVGEAIKLGKLVREAKSKGHDGLILENVDDTVDSSARKGAGHVTIAVFKKEQIVPGRGQLNLLAFNPDQARDESGRWTGGGGTSRLDRMAAGKAFYAIDQKNELFGHLSATDRAVYLEDFKQVPEARKAGAVEKTMDITNVVATQKSIEVSQVKELIEDPSLADDPEDGPPLLVTWHGRTLIGDGHHRIAAALLRGDKKMRVEYVNLDAYLRTAAFNPDQARDDHGRWTGGGPHAGQDPDDYEGRAPDVNWDVQDLQDSSKRVTAETIRKDYANNADVAVYQSMIDINEVDEKLVEEEDQEFYEREVSKYESALADYDPDDPDAEEPIPPDEPGGYDWTELKMRGTPPPAKVEVRAANNRAGYAVTVLDGNHRIRFWRDNGYDLIPAWVVDYRKPAKKMRGASEWRALYDPDQARDEHGRWTPGAGSDQSWQKEDRSATVLNGVGFQEEPSPDFSRSVDHSIDEPPFPKLPKGKHAAAGVVVTEPDGRVWMMQPYGKYGGYKNTFPKGTVDPNEDPQETAAREVWEETGLVVQITGHLADVERTTSVTRFYEGKRIGGAPWAHGKETYAVRLLPIEGQKIEGALKSVFGKRTSDHAVLDALRESRKKRLLARAAEFNPEQARDERGQWTVGVDYVGGTTSYKLSDAASKLADDDDFIWENDLLPSLDGLRPAGISETENARKPGAAKRLNDLAKKHDINAGFAIEVRSKERLVGIATVMRSKTGDKDYPDFIKAAADYMGGHGLSDRQERVLGKWLGFPKKSTEEYLKRKKKWGIRDAEFNPDQPRDERGQWTDTGGEWPSGLKNISGAEGSNPGGTYRDASGQKWYVKRYNNPKQAQTEHIANAIYRAVGVDAPHSVLGEGGDYASKIIPSDGTLAQAGLTRERADRILDGFAADVFLANWDTVGTGHDNVLVSGDKVTRIDQGGTLLFRAQGALKPESGLEKIDEWDSLVEKNVWYAKVFKAAGIKDADSLGDRAAKQIDRIVKARPLSGWKELVDRVAPKADPVFRARVSRMLEKRQALLEKKAAELRGKKVQRSAEFNPDQPLRALYDPNQPRVPAGSPEGGQFASDPGGPAGEKKKKAPKAPPVPLESKKAAYEEVKKGATFKKTAEKYGMTQGQLSGYVWKIDQAKKKAEEALSEQEAAASVVKAVPAVQQKPWAEMSSDEKLTYAHEQGYEWKPKPESKSGNYAWYDKDGVQVSGYGPKESHREKLETINYGAGIVPKVPDTPPPAGKWPISNDTERALSDNFKNKMSKAHQPWKENLTGDEHYAVENYTGSAYVSLNKALRKGGGLSSSDASFAAKLNSAMAKAPSPPPPDLVWRGISSQDASKIFEGLKNGDTINLRGFQSSSIDPNFAKSWAGANILFEIKPSKGMYAKLVSSHPHEYEYILPHNAKYTVRGVSHVKMAGAGGKVRVLQLEMHGG